MSEHQFGRYGSMPRRGPESESGSGPSAGARSAKEVDLLGSRPAKPGRDKEENSKPASERAGPSQAHATAAAPETSRTAPVSTSSKESHHARDTNHPQLRRPNASQQTLPSITDLGWLDGSRRLRDQRGFYRESAPSALRHYRPQGQSHPAGSSGGGAPLSEVGRRSAESERTALPPLQPRDPAISLDSSGPLNRIRQSSLYSQAYAPSTEPYPRHPAGISADTKGRAQHQRQSSQPAPPPAQNHRFYSQMRRTGPPVEIGRIPGLRGQPLRHDGSGYMHEAASPRWQGVGPYNVHANVPSTVALQPLHPRPLSGYYDGRGYIPGLPPYGFPLAVSQSDQRYMSPYGIQTLPAPVGPLPAPLPAPFAGADRRSTHHRHERSASRIRKYSTQTRHHDQARGRGHRRQKSSRGKNTAHMRNSSITLVAPTYVPGMSITGRVDAPLTSERPPGGFYWAVFGKSPRVLRRNESDRSVEEQIMLPIQMCEPPLRNIVPAYPQALEGDPQPRTRKQSKYTAEQDRLILELKNAGKSWTEIAGKVKCHNQLAARNRYQVLIGQQGGGTFFWTTEDCAALQATLDEGERAKWQYLAKELSRKRGTVYTADMVHYKISKMFAENPEQFGVVKTTDPSRGGAPLQRKLLYENEDGVPRRRQVTP